MILNYIKMTLRNFRKNRFFYFVNLSGLALGFICFIFIGLYVYDEMSYDRYHEKADRTYRIGIDAMVNGHAVYGAISSAPVAQGLMDEFSEVESSTRFRRLGFPVVRYGDKVFSEERWFYTDSTVFSVFTLPLLEGDERTALTKPNTVVISESVKKKYFGEKSPLGKTLNLDKRQDFLVTGVYKDVPENSHLHYDFLSSMTTLRDSRSDMWAGSNNFYTYFVLKEGVDGSKFQESLNYLRDKYVYPQIQGLLGISVEEVEAQGGYFRYFMQPLTDIHLDSNMGYEAEAGGSRLYTYIFALAALAVLLIACINFINLSTAKAGARAKEIGVRKSIGSTKNQLRFQFVSEAVILSLFSAVVAFPVIHLLLPWFNDLSGKSLSIPYFESIWFIPGILLLFIAVGLSAGIYPAFLLASVDPVKVLKGEKMKSGSSGTLRNFLVIFQFAASIFLICGTFVIKNQMDYISKKNLGFKWDQVVIIHKVDDIGDYITAFKQDLQQTPGVLSSSNFSTLMGDSFGDNLFHPAENPELGNQIIHSLWADEDFVSTYKVEMVMGDYYEGDNESDKNSIVLNEKAIEVLQMKDPLGKKLKSFQGGEFTIKGIVKDFHFQPLQQSIRPLFIQYGKRAGRYLAVRFEAGNFQEILPHIRESWHKYAGNQAFEYEFFDDHFRKVYLAEQKTGSIFMVFAIVAIFVACLGLFGLASYITARRTKEIGIRKVLGASISSILFMHFMQFLKWILISNIIALPLAWYVMSNWLHDYTYKIELTPLVFILSAFISILIALITVGWQSMKSASANPVESLRYE